MPSRKLIASQIEAVLSELSRVIELATLDENSRTELTHLRDELRANLASQKSDQIESLLNAADRLIAAKANEVMTKIKSKIEFIFQEKAK